MAPISNSSNTKEESSNSNMNTSINTHESTHKPPHNSKSNRNKDRNAYQTTTTLEQDNLSAQQASFQSLSISQTTLETTLRQQEQLQHASDLLEKQRYQIQRSDRILKGMTWSGWFGNLWSKDVAPPDYDQPRYKDGNGSESYSQKRMRGRKEHSNSHEHSHGPTSTSNISSTQEQLLQELLQPTSTSTSVSVSASASFPTSIQSLPQHHQDVIALLLNYQTHVHLLNNCHAMDELETCVDVCSSLHQATFQSLMECREGVTSGIGSASGGMSIMECDSVTDQDVQNRHLVRRIEKKLNVIQQEQQRLSQQIVERIQSSIEYHLDGNTHTAPSRTPPSSSTSSSRCKPDSKLPSSSYQTILTSTSSTIPTSTPTSNSLSTTLSSQEDHLQILSQNLHQLQSVGANLYTSLQNQNELLEGIEEGTEQVLDQTNMVRRRADRLAHRSMWKSPKADFECWVLLQNLQTKQYLSVYSPNHQKYQLCLVPELDDMIEAEMCIFGVYKRRGCATTNTTNTTSAATNSMNEGDMNMGRGGDDDTRMQSLSPVNGTTLGFKSKLTNKWLGQSFMGSLVCSASKFGSREEWELDNHTMERTKLLCASANWGSGGWLKVDETTGTSFTIGGFDTDSKQNASLWSVIVLET